MCRCKRFGIWVCSGHSYFLGYLLCERDFVARGKGLGWFLGRASKFMELAKSINDALPVIQVKVTDAFAHTCNLIPGRVGIMTPRRPEMTAGRLTLCNSDADLLKYIDADYDYLAQHWICLTFRPSRHNRAPTTRPHSRHTIMPNAHHVQRRQRCPKSTSHPRIIAKSPLNYFLTLNSLLYHALSVAINLSICGDSGREVPTHGRLLLLLLLLLLLCNRVPLFTDFPYLLVILFLPCLAVTKWKRDDCG